MLLTYAVLLQVKQTVLNLLNNKQLIYSVSMSVQLNTRKEIRNTQLLQFDLAIQIMLPSDVPVLPTLNVIN